MYVRMKRTIIEQLKAWKESLYRKPLILSGARQVGKTYILQEFGKQEYDHVAYINCDGNSEIANIFAEDYDMKRVLMVIGAISKQPIIPGKTLIILDEIQELHKGLSSLKYFCENAPEYHVAVAGSLLGLPCTKENPPQWERLTSFASTLCLSKSFLWQKTKNSC